MIRHILLSALLAASLLSSATAQIPTKGNVFFGYSYLSSDLGSGSRGGLSGWNGSLEGKIFPFIGVVADFSGHYASENFPVSCGGISSGCVISAKAHVYNVLFGPRVSVPIGKFTPFAEAFVGASHISGSAAGFSSTNTSFADALGGGLDYRIIHGLGARFEGDLVQSRFFSGTQNNARLSIGLVLQF